MKRRNLTHSLALVALITAVTAYIALYIVGMLKNSFQTVPAVRYTSEENFSAKGYVVRNEEVLYSGYDLIKPICAPGQKVAKGEVIARVYSDEETYKRVLQIDELELKLLQIQNTFNSESSGGDAPSLEAEIQAAVMALSRTSAKDSLHDYGILAENLKGLLLRKEYIVGSSENIEQTVSRLQSEIASLKAAGDSGFTDIRAERAGTFSPNADGYERILNTSVLEGMTLDDFDNLETFEASVPQGAYGKIISGIKWCFVAAVDSEEIEGLGEKDTVNVLFSGNYGRRVEMSILYLQESSGGRTLVTLQAKDDLYAVSALRLQTVEVAFGAYEGIRIPKKALVISSDGTRGVYCAEGVTASFKKVTIVKQSGDYYIVREDRSDPFALRVGNEVIITLKGVYEGKILE